MPDTPTATGTTVTAKRSKPSDEWFRVVLTHPNHHGRVVFRSLSEKRARAWLAAHYPRGSEAHLVTPGGGIQSYEAERSGERGADTDQWADFDPSEWTPTEQAPPPGQDEWSDKEG